MQLMLHIAPLLFFSKCMLLQLLQLRPLDMQPAASQKTWYWNCMLLFEISHSKGICLFLSQFRSSQPCDRPRSRYKQSATPLLLENGPGWSLSKSDCALIFGRSGSTAWVTSFHTLYINGQCVSKIVIVARIRWLRWDLSSCNLEEGKKYYRPHMLIILDFFNVLMSPHGA